MQIKNDYELDIYNGDIGFIVENNFNNRELIIDFYGELKAIPFSPHTAIRFGT